MKRLKWNKKRTLAALFFGVATFAISFVLGNGITMAFGPGTSGLLTIVITTILVVCAARITELAGVFTLMVTLFTFLAIPTNLFGPAGPQKVLIGLATGLTYDIVWEAFKRNKWSLPFAAALSTAVSIVLIWRLMVFLDHPKAEYLAKYIYYMIPAYGILGFLGAMCGNWVYDKYFSQRKIVAVIKE
jgi:hypothetical protein